jgi:immune inhibitor InhA-like protein
MRVQFSRGMPLRGASLAATIAAMAAMTVTGCATGPKEGEDEGNRAPIETQVGVATQALGPTCIDITHIADSPIRSDAPTSNYGTKITAVTGSTFGQRIALMGFDLGAIPAGMAILSSTVILKETNNIGAATIDVHRATAAWTQNGVTWNSFGSAIASPPVTSFSNNGSGYTGALSFDITALTQGWLNGSIANQGIGLVSSGPDTTFGAVENTTAALRPVLHVCYTNLCAGVVCAAPDQCHTAGTCNPGTGVCSNPAKTNGTSCNDGNACTQADTCQAGACTGASPVTCTAADQCHGAGTCNPGTGACSTPALADGTSCNDGSACTQSDTCQAGTCAGGNPVVCAAADQCHGAGTCNPGTGACNTPTLADGTACNDGNACTQTDTCQAGACAGANPVTCGATDSCHTGGTCDPSTGACAPSAPKAVGSVCDDGDACTLDDTCQVGCSAQSVTFTILHAECGSSVFNLFVNGVLAQTVSPTVGCTCNSTPQTVTITDPAILAGIDGCNDDFSVTIGGSSPNVAVATVKADVVYANGPPTTVCLYDNVNQNCAPRELCNGFAFNQAPIQAAGDCSQACSTGGTLGCVGTNPVICDASDSCHLAGTCDPSNGVCSDPVAPDGSSCDDGDSCTSGDTCNVGSCESGNALVCQALDQCHVAGACDSASGCSNPAAPVGTSCDDSNACTVVDACDAGGACVPGTPLDCDDGIACTIDGCDPSGGCTHDASQCVDQVCGTVIEQANNVLSPSSGASVTVACNSPNNVIKGTAAAANGSYCVTLSGGELNCNTLYFSAGKVGFTTQTKVSPGDFALVYGGTVNVDFQIDATNFGTCIDDSFEDDVEGAVTWTTSAPQDGVSWQRKTNNPIVLNNAVGNCVNPAPNEASVLCAISSDPACIPQVGAISNAYSGTHAYWFGNSTSGTYTGNFLGANGSCNSNSGGSGQALGGTLTSPSFAIPSGTTLLQFRAWWEIESVDPQQFAYDQMLVQVVDASSGVTILGTLNPQVDANGAATQPYSSGGFDTAPVWNLYTFDMSAFAGQNVSVRFEFSTQDGNYNGYRGWLVDDVVVTGSGCP